MAEERLRLICNPSILHLWSIRLFYQSINNTIEITWVIIKFFFYSHKYLSILAFVTVYEGQPIKFSVSVWKRWKRIGDSPKKKTIQIHRKFPLSGLMNDCISDWLPYDCSPTDHNSSLHMASCSLIERDEIRQTEISYLCEINQFSLFLAHIQLDSID